MRLYPCCECCPDVDPEWHAENGRDTHDTSCTLCDHRTAATVSVTDANRVLAEERATHEKTAAELGAALATIQRVREAAEVVIDMFREIEAAGEQLYYAPLHHAVDLLAEILADEGPS